MKIVISHYFWPKVEYCYDSTRSFQNIYFDTCVLSPASIRFLTGLVGAKRVMFGTDFPFEIGDAYGELALPVIQTMHEEHQKAILGGNAVATLEIKS